eukprot:gene12020-25182_t
MIVLSDNAHTSLKQLYNTQSSLDESKFVILSNPSSGSKYIKQASSDAERVSNVLELISRRLVHNHITHQDHDMHSHNTDVTNFSHVNIDVPKIKFVIFTAARTGSTYLCDLLSRHPSLEMNYEIFNPRNGPFVRIVHQHQIPNSFLINKRHNPKAFLDKVWSLSSDNNITSAVGFKIFHNHLDWSVVENLLILDQSIKKIILVRSDILSVYLSHTIALQTKIWSKVNTSNYTIEMNVTEFNSYKDIYIDWFHMILSRLRLTRQKYVLLEYNHDLDDVNNVRQTLDSIQSFLGVSRTDPDDMLNSTTFIKQASSGAPIE